MITLAQTYNKRTRKDVYVRRLVTVFGCSILIMLLVLVWHLITQTAPLFIKPQLELNRTLAFDASQIVSAGDILDGGSVVRKVSGCSLEFVTLANQQQIIQRYVKPCTHTLKIIEERDQRWLFDVSQTGQVRITGLDNSGVNSGFEPQAPTFAFALPDNVWAQRQDADFSISLPHIAIRVTNQTQHQVFWFNINKPTDIHQDNFSRDNDMLLLPGLREVLTFQNASLTITPQGASEGVTYPSELPINWVERIENSRSLYIASGLNTLTRWVVSNQQGKFVFSPTYSLALEGDEIPLKVESHADSNAALLLTNQNRLLLFNRVTGEILRTVKLTALPLNISWFGNRVYLVYAEQIEVWNLRNTAGVTTLSSLFSPQWYEGYGEQQHIYQTTSGSDFQEAKYALIPLLIGSFKAAITALLVAIPISLGAAIYTGFFAKARWRNTIKPVIEMLEAVPSVVIGFIAAISLAPLAEELLVALTFFLVSIPIILFCLALVQHKVIRKLSKQIRFGSEIIVAIVGIFLWGAVSLWITGQFVPTDMFAGMSKTTLVVAVALGLAISPTIYTLAEDAIDSVPVGLKNASFALGATRLQTLRNIVLRVAMPGIIAAVMLGFGRAFGETMIVLMVTGNTPIPSWDLFESLRALTANIAIELPEAESGSALYTILFFTALMLFAFTFVFNTLAEWLRHTMREKVKYD